MNDKWNADRPPTESEVAGMGVAWGTTGTGKVYQYTGFTIRYLWGDSVIAWQPMVPPEPYVREQTCPTCGRRM